MLNIQKQRAIGLVHAIFAQHMQWITTRSNGVVIRPLDRHGKRCIKIGGDGSILEPMLNKSGPHFPAEHYQKLGTTILNKYFKFATRNPFLFKRFASNNTKQHLLAPSSVQSSCAGFPWMPLGAEKRSRPRRANTRRTLKEGVGIVTMARCIFASSHLSLGLG